MWIQSLAVIPNASPFLLSIAPVEDITITL